MEPRSYAAATTSDPTSVLDFFDSLGVFAELNGLRDSLSTPHTPRRGAPVGMDVSEAQSSFGHQRNPHGHFSGSFSAGYGDSLVRTASPVPSDPFTSGRNALQFSVACSLHDVAKQEDENDEDYESPGKKQKTMTKKKKKKKPSGQRQREELTFLRNTLAELKDKLRTLKHETSLTLTANTDTVPTTAALWLELAQRQQEARERAEAENAELRAQVDAQLKFAKTLERAMEKRKLLGSLKDDQQRRCVAMAAEDSTIFTAMKNSVNDRARQLDGVFSAQGLTQDSPGIRNEAKWALNEENRLRIDFISCKATLFDMPAMTKVVWGRIAMSNVSVDKSVGLITEVVNDSPDVKFVKQSAIISSYTGSNSDSGSLSEGKGEDRVTVARIVCRRIVAEHRVRFVWETQTEPRGAVLRRMPPLQLTEQGCGQIFESSVSPGRPKRTMLQSIVSVTPKLPGNHHPGASSAELLTSSPKELSELIIASFQENADSERRMIENQLMDQLAVRSSATTTTGGGETEDTSRIMNDE